MYDNNAKDTIIDSLGNKINSICQTAVNLASQGYLINKAKYIRLAWSSILIHAYQNINVLDKEQQAKLDYICNKVNAI